METMVRHFQRRQKIIVTLRQWCSCTVAFCTCRLTIKLIMCEGGYNNICQLHELQSSCFGMVSLAVSKMAISLMIHSDLFDGKK